MTDGRAMTGRLAGIARHAVPKGPMEVIDTAIVTLSGGIEGDCRGRVKPGGRGRRQVTLMERIDWDAALAAIDRDLPWQERRANLLVEDFDLPQIPGTRLRIGPVLLEITMECDPCHRMDAIADGLQTALKPDWRGGVCTRVIEGGTIRIGDNIRIEES
ncbi:MOSC domain-containing protein [Sphingomonas sanguinis]|uniref:MOSC domain-containing protein n=1 Tax=Sphingomonas sp. LC-1 TaxID=3110957 RepID=UPI0021BBB38D|nr:MOSC domain-containing protein [Sphingomonas sp. LC-1]MCT8000707.1 MOSC domain-containing protein [Sphingomonas sp. LC-1]